MTILTTAAVAIAGTADFVYTNLKSYFFKKFMDKQLARLDDKQEFALRRVIYETVDEYAAKYPVGGTSTTFPFYHSERIMSELLTYRVMHGDEYDVERLSEAFKAELNVIQPTEKNISDLFAIFIEKVNASPELKKLEIKETFENEIFLISKKLSSLQEYIEKAFAGFHADLELQWKDRIETYVATLQAFKPQTALNLLDALLKSLEAGTKKPPAQLLASIAFQRGICLRLLINKVESCKAFIKAYQLDSANTGYEEQAGLAYHKLGDYPKAIELADRIIARDEFNSMGWAVRVLNTAITELTSVLAQIPQIVKGDVAFQISVYNTFSSESAQAQLKILYDQKIIPPYSAYSPKPISIDNIGEHSFWLNVMVNAYFHDFFFEFQTVHSEEKEGLVQALNELLSRFFEAIKGTELSDEQADLRFMFAFTNYLLTDDIQYALEMKTRYKGLKNKPLPFLLICANVLQIAGETAAAISILEASAHQGSEVLMLLAYCYLASHQPELYARSVKKVTESLSVVPHAMLYGYVNHMIDLKTLGLAGELSVAEFVEGKEFENDTDKKLVQTIAEALLDGITLALTAALLELSNATTDPRAQGLIATTLHLCGEDEQALAIFDKFINKTEESRDLYHYIRALYNTKKNNKELLELLEKWRLHCWFDPFFARTELHAYRELTNWPKCVEIAEYYLSNEPDDEDVLMHYIYALHEDGSSVDLEKLAALVIQVRDYNYRAPEHARLAANILIKRRYFTEALDLLYRYAIDTANKPLRMAYFMAFTECKTEEAHLWPIKDYDAVEAGHFVKYKLNGKVKFVELNETNLKNPFNQEFIGCGKGGAFTVKRPMSSDEDLVTVERIMDKYLSLHDEILEEVHENPYSGIPLQSFTIDEGNVVESMHNMIRKIMGESGSRERDRIVKELAEYYDFKRSFSEVIVHVYREDYLAGYFDLARNKKGINMLPIGNFDNIVAKNYAIDLSSLPILYQMYLQHGTVYPEKFVISKYIIDKIKKQLLDVKANFGEQLHVTVTNEAITPSIIPENVQESNIRYISDLLQWVEKNCTIEITERVLDFTREIDIDENRKGFLNYFLNTSLLLEERVGLVLITDDMFYRGLGVSGKRIVSSEYYAKQILPYEAPALDEFIVNKYRGFSLSLTQLNNEYSKKLANQTNFYTHCLENLSLSINPSNARIALEHIKSLVINSLIDPTQLQLEITSVFVNLFRGVNMPGLKRNLQALVTEHFKLLGTKQDMVLRCLYDAFHIAEL